MRRERPRPAACDPPGPGVAPAPSSPPRATRAWPPAPEHTPILTDAATATKSHIRARFGRNSFNIVKKIVQILDRERQILKNNTQGRGRTLKALPACSPRRVAVGW